MNIPNVKPTVTEINSVMTDSEYTHDAYGLISISHISNARGTVLFGSDLTHGNTVRLQISRAKMQRHLSTDWYQKDGMLPMIEIEMSSHQFAELITTPNRGEGTPCTLQYAPARGTKLERMPTIAPLESKAELHRSEIKKSAKEMVSEFKTLVDKLGSMVDGGAVSKKELRELQRSMSILTGNMPSNMKFVVEQAEEALDKAVTSAKMDVEAYITGAINRLGIEAATGIGLTAVKGVAQIGDENGSSISQ